MINKTSRPPSVAQPTEDNEDRGWAQLGENATQILGMTRRGEREKVIAAVAIAHDAYTNKVWKAAGAWEFVSTRIGDPRLREQLLGQPLSLVDVLALWSKYDPTGAEAAARELVEGKHTFRSLQDAERAARPHRVTTMASRTAAWRDAVASALLAGPAHGFDVIAAPRKFHDSPADLWFQHRKTKVGVQVVGPLLHPRDYRRGIPARVYSGLGLVHLGHEAWIALPVDTAGDRYEEMAGRVAPGQIKIVQLALPAYADL